MFSTNVGEEGWKKKLLLAQTGQATCEDVLMACLHLGKIVR